MTFLLLRGGTSQILFPSGSTVDVGMSALRLTDGLRVAAQHVEMLGPLLLNAALHAAERSVHPLSEAPLDLTVVLLHLRTHFT